MLKLFADIFGHEGDSPSKLPPSLVETVIERAVDGTDPRLRIVRGYKKALKESVIHAADHIIDLIDSLPEPVVASKASLATDPALAALFYSEDSMNKIISRDAAMREFRSSKRLTTGPVTALLVAHRTEKHGFGYAEVGDQVLDDVPRTTISFGQHLLLEPTVDEQETRRLLKRRAFDHLLSVALLHIARRKEDRDSLTVRRALLRSKLDITQRTGGFAQHTAADDQARLQARLEEIEQQLSGLGTPEDVLAGNLATIADVLSKAERHLWLEDKLLCLDRLYVVHEKPGSSAPQIVFKDLHDSEGRQVSLQMVKIQAG
jgi:hypothetical protein